VIPALSTPLAGGPDPGSPPRVDLALYLLSLLRFDVSPEPLSSEGGLARFLTWWQISGRDEYPATFARMSEDIVEEQRVWLGAPFLGLPQDAELPITRFLYGLWLFRHDLSKAFDLAEPSGRQQFVCWVGSYGLLEHGRGLLLSDEQRRRLRAASSGPTGWTLAMWLLWHGCGDLQQSYPLDEPYGEKAFAAWYRESGARQWNHHALWQSDPSPRPRGGPPVPSSCMLRSRVTLVGFARGEFGIGEDVRMAALACSSVGLPVEVVDTPTLTHRQEDRRLDAMLTTEPSGAVNIFCMTGFDTAANYVRRPELFDGRYNIGYWPWELPEWPDRWMPAFQIVDEVWTSSRYTHEAFSIKSPIPVLLMPMAVELTTNSTRGRKFFGLPEEPFLFIFVFDWNSYSARKNPYACIKAFQNAFQLDDYSVGLVIKTMGLNMTDPACQRMLEQIAKDPRIHLIQETLDRSDILGLVGVCDALVSLHRSEGFGRTLAEAMLLKKPVICTAYSGNVDFCMSHTAALVPAELIPVKTSEYPEANGMYWADPDIHEAAASMRHVRSDCDYREAIATAGHALVTTRYNRYVVGERYKSRLRYLGFRWV